MDTKTPPIPLKPSEKPQLKKAERVVDVSLPPLTPHHPTHRSKNKSHGTSWSQEPPCALHHQDHRKKRPYRVLHIGATPLMHACQQGERARVLRLLKEQEETITYRDRTLRNALHYCMDAGTGGAVAAAAPELVNAPDAEGHTPLHLAVIAGDTQLVAVLLANGADVNAKDLEGHSVLHWATVCGETECVRLVLAAGARPSTPDLRGGSPLHYAAQCCGAAATAELAVPKKVGLTILQTLLEYGADVNAKDEDGRQPILWAASAGSVEAVLALARAGGSAAAGTSDKDGLTALHCAASRGHARCVEALVNLCGSHPDHVDDNGCSALHYAATLGHADATALILKLGADPNRQDRKGRTPALCAAAKGQLETLKILSQHGASLHARTVRGTGIGHEAVASGRIELIRWLAKRRPSTLDVATHDGKTPLHVAALHGHLDACKVLLDHGAKINAVLRTSKGNSMTPLDAALYKGHRDCAKLIQMHGGTTAQQLKTHKTTPSKAKFRVKRTDSSTASDSSPCRRGHPELYYEERWTERRTRRKSNARKLACQDSRSFSEEEVRLSKTSSRKNERRARSESARFDENGGHNLRRKRRRSTKYKHEYSSAESDSCDYSYDGDEGKATARRQHAKTRQERDKNRRTEVRDNSRKEEDDDDRSVSDDSLEVIVVKKSLEKKCEKVVSGRRSKTPRECTKETKVTKLQTRSSTKTSKSGKSKAPDDDTSAANREDRSPSKEEEEEESASKTLAEEVRDDEDRAESRYQRDVTDSTSQETVERVVVTAMVHKNQAPDTPKSTLEAERETKLDGDSKEREGTCRDINASDENEILSRKTDVRDVVEEKPPRTTQESLKGDEIRDKGEKVETTISSGAKDARKEETTDDKQLQGRLETLENVTSSDKIPRETHEAAKDEIRDKSEDLIENKERKLPAPQESKLGIGETDARKKSLSDDEQSKTVFSRQDVHKTASENNVEDARVSSEEKSETDQASVKAAAERSPESASDEAKESGDFELSEKTREDKKQKAETSVTERQIDDKDLNESVANVEETFTPERTDSPNKKSDYSSSSSPKPSRSVKTRYSRPSTGRNARRRSSSKASAMKHLFERSSEERLPHQRAIVAVIDSPEWDEDEAVEKEIREALGEDVEQDTEHEEDNEIGVMRVLPSTSEEETPSTVLGVSRTSRTDFLPQVRSTTGHRLVTINPEENRRLWRKQRRDSGGRDSGIEPSPRVSRIPKRRNIRCCPNTAKQQALNMETITRDVQISLRRYHLERKIFFQLMELKRLQIRHGRANEHVLVKRQVEAFHRSGMSGPIVGVAKYDRPLTFRQFEAFLYEQLRKLQGRPTTPDFCTEAKQCTQKTHRCHHATSAYTSIPVYTYLGGGGPDRADHLPKIESRGKGQMTVEVTHGEEKQVIALPTEKLDRTKRYFVTFTVRGETQDGEKSKSSCNVRRNAQSV